MRRALVDMRPDRFEDLIALVALYRPGPMANIPTYCARKRGDEEVEYLHPLLEPILAPTYGVITYQEQVQQIAQALAGYTLAEADLLRRAMGKKIKSEMDAQRERFLAGAEPITASKRGLANTIFDACAKFAEYGFNKSHSAPYGYITYQTAYLKAHFTQEFIAASMTYDMGNTDKLSEFREDAKKHGIEIVAPSVNTSEAVFTARDGKIFYAIGAIKGVGQAVAEHIVEARGDKPVHATSPISRRASIRASSTSGRLETLVNAGAFDCLVPKREQAFFADRSWSWRPPSATNANAAEGIMDMFASDSARADPAARTNVEAWNLGDRLERERGGDRLPHLGASARRPMRACSSGSRVISYAEFERGVKEAVSLPARLAGTDCEPSRPRGPRRARRCCR